MNGSIQSSDPFAPTPTVVYEEIGVDLEELFLEGTLPLFRVELVDDPSARVVPDVINELLHILLCEV